MLSIQKWPSCVLILKKKLLQFGSVFVFCLPPTLIHFLLQRWSERNKNGSILASTYLESISMLIYNSSADLTDIIHFLYS